MWDDALQIIEQHPAYAPQVYLPYAQWLAEQDRFVEAQAAYTKAGQGEQGSEAIAVSADGDGEGTLGTQQPRIKGNSAS